MMSAAGTALLPADVPITIERLRGQRERFLRAIEDIDAAIMFLEQRPEIDIARFARTILVLGRLQI
jgi:hypothetical protein